MNVTDTLQRITASMHTAGLPDRPCSMHHCRSLMFGCAALQFFVTLLCLFTLCLPQRELLCRLSLLFSYEIAYHISSIYFTVWKTS